MTYSNLWDLVENDNENHKLKEIADLFLTAMNDWPAMDQELISEFITELETYFGSPLTLEKIDSKKLEMTNLNSWRHESGSSIAEMIELSKLYYGESNFEKIVAAVLKHYSEQNSSQ